MTYLAQLQAQQRMPSLAEMISQAKASRRANAERELAREAAERDRQYQLEQAKFGREQQLQDRDFRERQFQAQEKQRALDTEQFKAKADAEKAAKTQALAQERAKRTAAVVQGYTQMPPEQQQKARPFIERLAQSGQIDPFDFDQAAVAAPIGAALHGLKTERPDDPRWSDYARRLTEEGLKPGSPEFNQAMAEYNRAELARMKRPPGGVNVNIGDKALPVNTVQELADADAAEQALDDLLSSFRKNVPAEGIAGQVGARVAAKIPNTDASTYDKEAGVAAQVVGTFLEGGKLQASDFDRYKTFLPQAGDSPEVAERKVANVKRMIAQRNAARSSALGSAGYRVPQQSATAAKPSAIPDTDRAQIIEAYKAKLGRAPTDDEISQTYAKAKGGR